LEKATVAIVLYKSKVLKNGEHPLMIRITKNRKVKYISLGLSCHANFWNSEKHEPRKNHPNRDILDAILIKKKESYLNQILDYKKEGKDFTPDVLIQRVEKEVCKITIFDFFDSTIERLIGEKRVGYSKVYKIPFHSISKR
jgi:hypothetical protein